jgi:hypothetical protein
MSDRECPIARFLMASVALPRKLAMRCSIVLKGSDLRSMPSPAPRRAAYKVKTSLQLALFPSFRTWLCAWWYVRAWVSDVTLPHGDSTVRRKTGFLSTSSFHSMGSAFRWEGTVIPYRSFGCWICSLNNALLLKASARRCRTGLNARLSSCS